MPSPDPSRRQKSSQGEAVPDEFFLAPQAVRRAFDAASGSYDAAAAVQREIGARLLERLDLIRMQPGQVLDLGAGTGQASRALKRRYRNAQVWALDLSTAMLHESRRQQGLLRRFARAAADAHHLPIRTASIDLVFSNLMLEWCHDPDAVFREIRRVLKPEGLFMFTTLGPDTLVELRNAWRGVDRHAHVHRFIDMHDLGDALMRARFADPVMDMERLSITYPNLDALRRELRTAGAGNLAHGRPKGLTGRARARALRGHDALALRNGRLSVSVEVVYGQAWVGSVTPGRTNREDPRERSEFRISVQSIGRRGTPS